MNVLAIADAFVPETVLRDALSRLHPSRLRIVEWSCQDVAQLHHRTRRIEQLGPDAEPPPPETIRFAAEAEVIVTHLCPISSMLIRQAPNLQVVGVCRAGTENIDRQALESRGIRLCHVPGRNAVAVAEFTIGLIIAECRNIARAHGSIKSGGWRKQFINSDQPAELAGKTVGLVGLGAVGQMVASRLAPFNVDLLAHDPQQKPHIAQKHGGRMVPLDELLTHSDIVSLHARLAAEQAPLIGSRELRLMKGTACLINTARARLVDHDALLRALNERWIAGAALDVFEEEPLPADSALRALDNITLTSHLAGSTQEAFHRSAYLLVDAILRALPSSPEQEPHS